MGRGQVLVATPPRRRGVGVIVLASARCRSVTDDNVHEEGEMPGHRTARPSAAEQPRGGAEEAARAPKKRHAEGR